MQHRQQRILCFAAGPQHAWRVHHVAVALDRDREASANVAIAERTADRASHAVADAVAARAAEPLVVLLEWPQPERPAADVARFALRATSQVLDLAPDFHRETRGADRA